MNWRRLWCCCICKEKDLIRENKSKDYPWELYTLKEILHATNNFHNNKKIGEGGFGSIAVKRLKALTAKAEMEFAVEVEILGRVRHKNLLGLRGFYASGDERLIVYDYMPNHSLVTHLHGQLAANCLLDWPRRMSIAIGSAEGLADIKASNILLDANFQAKVADFGFAKLIPDGVTHMTTRRSLVRRKPLEKLPGGMKRDIVQWVTPYVRKGAFDRIADPRLKGKFDRSQLKSAVMLALRCTDSNPENRPSMSEVVEWLKGGVERRRKEVTDVQRMPLEDGDNGTDTDFEVSKMPQSDLKRERVAKN
ncbi:hypothetical protein V6N12_020351 [Hibiscus sabdariffa]|uniref:Protein kinase domain-containing protein n=1 Tax=Hibiscus sabdariffa TaxID=183260 RepID=A0ABR2B1M7_9ROSI